MEKNNLTLGSLFDGSGGFPLGGIIAGIEPKWASEIEPFPIRVTTKRLPQVKHYGDVSQMDGAKIEPVDIITFGSPCQDMSIAGKREGLGGSRSSLFYEAIRIVREMRRATNGEYPKYIVWENVTGAFSSNRGADFSPYSKASAASQTKPYLSLRLRSGRAREASWETVTPLPGECLTLSIGEFPREESASTLSQILQAGVPEKYYLSQKACLGILARASKRGKELPEVLRIALEKQAYA